MLKAKFGYRYPVPHDVKKIRTTYTKRISAVKEELVTEDIDVVRMLYGTRLNVETVKAIEFGTSASLDMDLPRDGLVLDIPFFEGQGTTYHDCSPNGYHASLVSGSASWEQLPNGEWVLDCYNTEIRSNVSLTITEFTSLVWIYVDTDKLPTDNKYRGMFLVSAYPALAFLVLFVNKSNTIIPVGGYVDDDFAVVGFIPPNKFTQIGLSWRNEDGYVAFYVNGVAVDTESNVAKGKSLNISYLDITGDSSVVGWPSDMYIKICFSKFYNRFLSEDEIGEVYELEKQILGV